MKKEKIALFLNDKGKDFPKAKLSIIKERASNLPDDYYSSIYYLDYRDSRNAIWLSILIGLIVAIILAPMRFYEIIVYLAFVGATLLSWLIIRNCIQKQNFELYISYVNAIDVDENTKPKQQEEKERKNK